MDTEDFIKYLQDTLTYYETEKLAEAVICEAEYTAGEQITEYDKILWLIRTAFIQGALATQTGKIFKIGKLARMDPETPSNTKYRS